MLAALMVTAQADKDMAAKVMAQAELMVLVTALVQMDMAQALAEPMASAEQAVKVMVQVLAHTAQALMAQAHMEQQQATAPALCMAQLTEPDWAQQAHMVQVMACMAMAR